MMLLLATAHAADLSLDPDDDWCTALSEAAPGTTVSLSEGDFPGPCWIRQSVTVIGHGSRIVYDGTSSNVLDIEADDVELLGLAFGPTNADIDAIKIRSGARVSISLSTFDRIGGISISANSADTSEVYVISNTFTDLQATGVYLGCHEGTCASRDFFIANNRFDGVTSTGVGYAIETKLNSYGMIGGNDIRDAQGPGITVYGSAGDELTTVEGNVVVSSRAAATLEIAGGPALVRNNVVIGGAGGGLYVYDYGDRGLLRDITVVGNTLRGVGGSAVVLEGWAAGRSLVFEGNAAGRDDGAVALPADVAGVPMAGNVDCPDPAACWVDAPAGDLWPLPGGALVGAGITSSDLPWDFCSAPRAAPSTAGALEPGTPTTGTFSAYAAPEDRCPPREWEDTGDDDGRGDSATPLPDLGGKGCGCASGTAAWIWFAPGLALAARRRRAR